MGYPACFPPGGNAIESHRERFIELLAEYDVIRFGDFVLKSGRKSPYFINAGELRTGRALRGLGRAYAERLLSAGLGCDLVFGPSYKGIPLAVATAFALAEGDREVGFCFDRKESKGHGEGGLFVGMAPFDGSRVVIVDDVITSGGSIRRAAELLRAAADVELTGIIVAVDRQERGREKDTLLELEEDLCVPVQAIVTIREIVSHLGRTRRLPSDQASAIAAYLDHHSANRP